MITNGYATADQLAAISGINTAQDGIIVDLAINAASRMIDGYCGWRFWQDATAVARLFDVTSRYSLVVTDDGDGISTTTGLIVKLDLDADGTFETTLTSGTDYNLLPYNAQARTPLWPYTEIVLTQTFAYPRSYNQRPGVQVTAKWGWPAVPDDITSACVLLARDLYKEMKSAPFGVAEFGVDGPLRIGRNRTAEMYLANYRKPAVG